jgi:hypothetical protein
MDTHIKIRYSLMLAVSIFFFVPCVSPVVTALRIFAGATLFYFLPGVFLTKRVSKKCSLISSIVLAVVVGMCFHIVYTYFLGLLKIPFTLYILLIPGVLFSILADYYTIQLPNHNPREVYLVLVASAFFLLTVTVSPGEDANGHLLLVDTIVQERSIPSTYQLYPEISMSYHMGFHIISVELEYVTESQNLRAIGSLFGVFMVFTSYLCVKNIYTEKAGLISGILIGFGVFLPLYYLSYGAYASMVLFALQPFVIFLVYTAADKKIFNILLLSLVLAAGIMSHTAFLLVVIPLFFLRKYSLLVPATFLGLCLSVPHLMRIQPIYSSQEIAQLYNLWYIPETFRLQMFAERIGVLMFVCSLLGFIFLHKRELTFFSVWVSSLGLLAATSVFRVEFPFWFVFFANRMVDFMVLPLVFLASIFVSEIGGKKWYIVVVLLMLPVIPHYYTIPRSCEGPLFPTDSPEFAADQNGIVWLIQNTDESAVILNDWWTGTGSSWITSLGKRQLIFPYLYVHDHFLDILDIPARSRDVLWITSAPDSKQSHTLLQEWGVTHIFLSSYVEDRVAWRKNAWNIQQLIESPHYDLVFNEDQTYIFTVAQTWTYTPLYTVKKVIIEPGDLNITFSESPSVKKLIQITYQDSFTGMATFWSDKGLLAEIPLLGTGDLTTLVLPFETFLHIEPDWLPITDVEIVAAFPGYTLGAAGLSPHWVVDEVMTLQGSGYIYTFGARTLTIHYKDTGPGTIDINLLVDNTWVPLTVIHRKGDNQQRHLDIPLSEYAICIIGITVHTSPFHVISIQPSPA